jgi:integrase
MSVREKFGKGGKDAGESTGYWLADFKDASGERHQQRFKSKKDAVAFEQKNRVAIREGTYVALDRNLTVSDAAKIWMARVEASGMRHHGPVEATTLNQYRQHVSLHIVPRVGSLKLAKMSPADAEKFRDSLLSKGDDGKPVMSRALARKVLTSFKSLLKANKCSHIVDDVSIGSDKRSERKLEVGRDFPTRGEVNRVAKAAADDPRLYALILTAALCGLRASELRGLRFCDLDFKAGELHVRQRADRFNRIGPPKSKEGRRTLPIDPELSLALKKWMVASRRDDQGYIFATSTGAIEHHKNMLRSLAPIMKSAGVVTKGGKPKYALHAFRHFYASWCINPIERGGRQLTSKIVQTLLGHSSIVMTMDTYGHMFPSGSDRSELAASVKSLLA